MKHSHIIQLDEEHIRALAGSAWEHQAGPLRDAIYKHVDRQASLSVYIPVSPTNVKAYIQIPRLIRISAFLVQSLSVRIPWSLPCSEMERAISGSSQGF